MNYIFRPSLAGKKRLNNGDLPWAIAVWGQEVRAALRYFLFMWQPKVFCKSNVSFLEIF